MERLAWCLLYTALLISPITMMAESSLTLLTFDILCLSACAIAIPAQRLAVGERFISSLLMPFLLIAVYLCFQISPLSPSLLKLLAPETWQAYQDTVWRIRPGLWMPISTHAEGTLYALFHVSALFSLCFAFGFLVNSHLRLVQFIQFFAYSVTLWLLLLIVTSFVGKFSVEFANTDATSDRLVVFLGQWCVVFLPLIVAGWSAFRRHDDIRLSIIGRILRSLTNPPQASHLKFAFNIFLMLVSLLIMRSSFLWLVALSGCLLFLSLKSDCMESQISTPAKIIRYAACASVVAMIVWSVALPQLNYSFAGNYSNNFEFSWFGHGLRASSNTWTSKLFELPIHMRGGGKEILYGMGGFGTILFVVALLSMFIAGGRSGSLRQTDKLTGNLYSGSAAGLIVLVIAGSFNSMWQWQSFTTCIICLVLIAAWTRRLSNLLPGEGYQTISTMKIFGLRGSVWLILVFSVLFVSLKTVPRTLFEIERPIQQINNDQSDIKGMEGWIKEFSLLNPYDGNLSLWLGQQYLVQERDEEAKVQILKALRLQPLSPQVHIAVASLGACTGDEDNAIHFFSTQAAGLYTPDVMTRFLVARLLKIKDSDAAVRLINLALKRAPMDASLYLNLLILQGYELLSLSHIISNQPMVMLALGNLLLSEGHKEEAENAYWAAIYSQNNNDQKDEELYIRIAKYFFDSNKKQEAILVAREGLEDFPGSSLLLRLVADLNILSDGNTN